MSTGVSCEPARVRIPHLLEFPKGPNEAGAEANDQNAENQRFVGHRHQNRPGLRSRPYVSESNHTRSPAPQQNKACLRTSLPEIERSVRDIALAMAVMSASWSVRRVTGSPSGLHASASVECLSELGGFGIASDKRHAPLSLAARSISLIRDNGRLCHVRGCSAQQQGGANDVSDAETEKHQGDQTVCAQHPKIFLFLFVLCRPSAPARVGRRKPCGPFAFDVVGDQMSVAMNDAGSVPAARMMKCLDQNGFCLRCGGWGVHQTSAITGFARKTCLWSTVSV